MRRSRSPARDGETVESRKEGEDIQRGTKPAEGTKPEGVGPRAFSGGYFTESWEEDAGRPRRPGRLLVVLKALVFLALMSVTAYLMLDTNSFAPTR
ncbi:MAG: hypothetical protein ACR2KW_11615 [Rubrobacter sp.]